MTGQAAFGWVVPAGVGTGLDHLAVQAPSTRMYSELVPGITNVTDRAAYLSFYPWLFWAWEQRRSSVPMPLEQLVRRGEVLFTLIGERHARVNDEPDELHGANMVGRQKLVPALRGLSDDAEIPVARFAAPRATGGDPLSYFQNRFGGLGQYYLGPMRELGILATSGGRHGYTPERGEPLARALGARAPTDTFLEALERGTTTPAELDAMAALCPCGLAAHHDEVELLLDLLLDRRNEQGAEAGARRESIALMLDLLSRPSPDLESLTGERWCRAAAYAGAVAPARPWVLGPRLERRRLAWAAYERHELFSVAMQTMLWAALHAVATSDTSSVRSTEAIGIKVAEQVRAALGARHAVLIDEALKDRTATLPGRHDWHLEGHESQQADRAMEAARDENLPSAVVAAVDVLLALVARGIPDEPYVAFRFEAGYFTDYPLHLTSLRALIDAHRHDWTLFDLVRHLTTQWGVEAHFRVALRKLHGEALDTFRLRPLDDELVWVASPEPTWTTPRLQNIERFLCDLGLAQWRPDGPATLTDAGRTALEALRG